MEPVTAGIIALIAFLSGSGAGAAVTGHSKNKIIADLQEKISILQRDLSLWQKRAAELSLELGKSQERVLLLDGIITEGQNQRAELILKLEEAHQRIESLNSPLRIIWLLLTFRLSKFLKNRDELIRLQTRSLVSKENIEAELSSAVNERDNLNRRVLEMEEENFELKKRSNDAEYLLQTAQQTLRDQSS